MMKFSTIGWLSGIALVFCLTVVEGRVVQAEAERLADGLAAPVGMAFDGANRLFIANWGAGRIDLWSPDRALEPYINGLPTPSGLAFDRQGRLYVATYSGGEILRFDQDKKREVFISGLSVVAGLYFDWHGNLLIAERGKSRVLKVSPEGEVSVLTDQGLTTPVAAIQVGKSSYVIADISGTVLLFDAELNRSRQLSTELSGPAIGLVFDPVSRDAVYAVDYGGRGIYRITLDGKTSVVEKTLRSPVAMAMDSFGALYVGTWSDNSLYRVRLDN